MAITYITNAIVICLIIMNYKFYIMNIVVINASQRKRANTAQLCKKVVDGAMDNGADVEYINLYSYDFKGCMSCFACHLKKNFENPLCFWRDDLKIGLTVLNVPKTRELSENEWRKHVYVWLEIQSSLQYLV